MNKKIPVTFMNAVRVKAINCLRKIDPGFDLLQEWFEIDGDHTLRLNYDLNHDSVVFDLGGFEGQWTSDIFSKYCCTVYVFEIVDTYYQKICDRFEKNTKIQVFGYGLGSANSTFTVQLTGDSTSIFGDQNRGCGQEVKIVKASDFIAENEITCIDLIKINIEGSEYDLLDHLIEKGLHTIVKNFQIQFHNIAPDSKDRMETIREELRKTHRQTYSYEWLWENWTIRN